MDRTLSRLLDIAGIRAMARRCSFTHYDVAAHGLYTLHSPVERLRVDALAYVTSRALDAIEQYLITQRDTALRRRGFAGLYTDGETLVEIDLGYGVTATYIDDGSTLDTVMRAAPQTLREARRYLLLARLERDGLHPIRRAAWIERAEDYLARIQSSNARRQVLDLLAKSKQAA